MAQRGVITKMKSAIVMEKGTGSFASNDVHRRNKVAAVSDVKNVLSRRDNKL